MFDAPTPSAGCWPAPFYSLRGSQLPRLPLLSGAAAALSLPGEFVALRVGRATPRRSPSESSGALPHHNSERESTTERRARPLHPKRPQASRQVGSRAAASVITTARHPFELAVERARAPTLTEDSHTHTHYTGVSGKGSPLRRRRLAGVRERWRASGFSKGIPYIAAVRAFLRCPPVHSNVWEINVFISLVGLQGIQDRKPLASPSSRLPGIGVSPLVGVDRRTS